MEPAAARRLVRLCVLTTATVLLGACATTPPMAATRNQIIISVRDQKMTVVKEDHSRVAFPISTSKFGLGDRRGTYETPTGEMVVASKIGGGAPSGSVFHGRVRTGEIVKIDAPGRDAIVTRILTLRGLEASNAQAFSRGIYIHGTPEERNIGRPTSYGCIRMRSRDVIALYEMVKVGARVQIIDTTQNQAIAANIVRPTTINPPSAPVPPNSDAAAAMGASVAANATAPDAGQTHVVKSITTSGSGSSVTRTTTSLTSNGAAPAVTTTTTTTKPGASAAVVAASAPATGSKKTWSGAPGKLLASPNAADARARQRETRMSAGSPTPAQPVSNESPGNNGNGALLSRKAVDSL